MLSVQTLNFPLEMLSIGHSLSICFRLLSGFLRSDEFVPLHSLDVSFYAHIIERMLWLLIALSWSYSGHSPLWLRGWRWKTNRRCCCWDVAQLEYVSRLYNFEHVTSSPYGLAEKYVQIVKRIFEKTRLDNRDPLLGILEYRHRVFTSRVITR